MWCSSNELSETALNNMFNTLYTRAPATGTIYLSHNPGSYNCDKSIAKNKGWSIMDY
jgi:hypothetical protein